MRDEIEVDEVRSLTDLANRNIQRAQMVPLEPSLSEEKNYPGDGGKGRGYRVISANALKKSSRNDDGTETRSTLMHVMDALVSHGIREDCAAPLAEDTQNTGGREGEQTHPRESETTVRTGNPAAH